jgi:hypothetical protein
MKLATSCLIVEHKKVKSRHYVISDDQRKIQQQQAWKFKKIETTCISMIFYEVVNYYEDNEELLWIIMKMKTNGELWWMITNR